MGTAHVLAPRMRTGLDHQHQCLVRVVSGAHAERACLRNQRQRPRGLPGLDEGACDDGREQHVEERAASLLRGLQTQLAVIHGERRFALHQVQQHARQVVLRRLGGQLRPDDGAELRQQRRGGLRCRAEQVQQRAEHAVEEAEPGQAGLLRDHAQFVESLEALALAPDQRRVVAEEDPPAGAPQWRQRIPLEQRRRLRDESVGALQVAGEVQALQQLGGDVGLRGHGDVLPEQGQGFVDPRLQHRVGRLTQHRGEHQCAVDAQPRAGGWERQPVLQQTLEHGNPPVEWREIGKLDVVRLDHAGGGERLAERVARGHEAVEGWLQHRA